MEVKVLDSISKRTQHELVDPNFISYQLSFSLLQNKINYTLSTPLRETDWKLDTSLARYQSKYKHNHLHIDSSRRYMYYIGTNWTLYQIRLDTTTQEPIIRGIFTVPEPDSTNNSSFLEEVSLQALDVNSAQYIFLSNGAGDLLLVKSPYNSEEQSQVVMKTKAFDGKPFSVLAAHYDPKSGQFRCAIRHIDDTALVAVPTSSQNIAFVPSSNDPMKDEVDQDAPPTLAYTAPTTATRLQTRFCLAVLTLALDPAVDSVERYTVAERHVLMGLAELQHCAFAPSGHQFAIISASPCLPFNSAKLTVSDQLARDSEVQSPFMNSEIMDPEALQEISARLARYTSETVDENPLMNLTSTGTEDYEDDEALGTDTPPASLYHYTVRDGAVQLTHEQPLRPCEVLSLDAVSQVHLHYYKLGLSLDVDCLLFHYAFNKEYDSDPTVEPLTMNHVASFDALAFVSKAKQNKKFLTVTSDNQHAILVEHTKFVYVYRHRTGEAHTAQHQVLEFGPEQFCGLRTLAGNRFALLTKDKLIICQL